MLKKDQFIDQYIATFSATYAAINYDELCRREEHEMLKSHWWMEEAGYLAEQAWEKYCKTFLDHKNNPDIKSG